ncbi:receptor-like protein 12 [Cucumis melo var. makuwa]|uniref:Receptor-like protein 12 n=1 Tax=Cucumis melo var. makuwa TaxID=1194695 RepID=A0A5D3CRW0_CUCMM|nr:receptor-like protein 12 [Cucumis melo var. makuwa]TYK13928.1 receptor-like protein 12 [Cucumis melo var. makuwa]
MLSHNNLFGEILRESHLSTFNEASSYDDNQYLCGDPLPTKCAIENSSEPQLKALGKRGNPNSSSSSSSQENPKETLISNPIQPATAVNLLCLVVTVNRCVQSSLSQPTISVNASDRAPSVKSTDIRQSIVANAQASLHLSLHQAISAARL